MKREVTRHSVNGVRHVQHRILQMQENESTALVTRGVDAAITSDKYMTVDWHVLREEGPKYIPCIHENAVRLSTYRYDQKQCSQKPHNLPGLSPDRHHLSSGLVCPGFFSGQRRLPEPFHF